MNINKLFVLLTFWLASQAASAGVVNFDFTNTDFQFPDSKNANGDDNAWYGHINFTGSDNTTELKVTTGSDGKNGTFINTSVGGIAINQRCDNGMYNCDASYYADGIDTSYEAFYLDFKQEVELLALTFSSADPVYRNFSLKADGVLKLQNQTYGQGKNTVQTFELADAQPGTIFKLFADQEKDYFMLKGLSVRLTSANNPVSVPEPASLALLAFGLIGLGTLRRKIKA